jgi:TonB family protein
MRHVLGLALLVVVGVQLGGCASSQPVPDPVELRTDEAVPEPIYADDDPRLDTPPYKPPEPSIFRAVDLSDRAIRRLRKLGQVRIVVDYVVTPEGKPVRLTIARSSGDDRLDFEAAQGVARVPHDPATVDGEPVTVRTSFEIVLTGGSWRTTTSN